MPNDFPELSRIGVRLLLWRGLKIVVDHRAGGGYHLPAVVCRIPPDNADATRSAVIQNYVDTDCAFTCRSGVKLSAPERTAVCRYDEIVIFDDEIVYRCYRQIQLQHLPVRTVIKETKAPSSVPA